MNVLYFIKKYPLQYNSCSNHAGMFKEDKWPNKLQPMRKLFANPVEHYIFFRFFVFRWQALHLNLAYIFYTDTINVLE